MAKRHWLMKSEPGSYSIDDLKRDGSSSWDGVRNYQARNFLRDEMKPGDLVLFYHSNAEPPGVAGVAKVASEPHPDKTQFDKRSKYFDAASKPDDPRWWLVDIEFVERFPGVVSLPAIKDEPALAGILVAKRGMRLSVQPVEKDHFDVIRKMGKSAGRKTSAK
jgi:predicted RNA-binding protein with PUA-like domain